MCGNISFGTLPTRAPPLGMDCVELTRNAPIKRWAIGVPGSISSNCLRRSGVGSAGVHQAPAASGYQRVNTELFRMYSRTGWIYGKSL